MTLVIALCTFIAVSYWGFTIMAQLDDIKAELADIKQSQADAAVSAADLSDDVDQLLALVQAGPTDLTEVEATIKDIQSTARAQADALKAASGKFPVPPAV